jgi:uncharacterized protein
MVFFLRVVIESFFIILFSGGIMVWLYNRYFAFMRESYLKKALSLGTLPLAVVFGLGHGIALFMGWPVFSLAAVGGAIFFLIKCRSVLLRHRYNHLHETESCASETSGINYPSYPFVFKVVLSLVKPWNQVDQLEVAIHRIPIKDLPDEFDGFRILFASDFHVHPTLTTEYFQHAVRQILERKADVLVLGGDFVSRSKYRYLTRSLLEPLKDHPEILAIRGNHDFWTRPDFFRQMIESWGGMVLSNEVYKVQRGDSELAIVGLESPYIPLTGQGKEQLRDELKGGPSIGIVHTPFSFPITQELGCHVTIAGHTHGGQIRFPFLGTTIASCNMKEQFVYGRGKMGNMVTLVSNGIGAFYPMRVSCPPQLVEVVLEKCEGEKRCEE